MNQEVQKIRQELIAIANSDSNILGLFPTGSFGKGMITDKSDYDVTIIIRDKVKNEYQVKYKGFGGVLCDLSIKTMGELKEAANWGGSMAWDRYNYAYLKTEVDKTGKIQKLIDEKGVVPADKRGEFVSASLDGFINQVYRSVKCFRDGNKIASQLEAADGLPSLLNAIFGLEGRIKPFYKYLDWELTNRPLKKLPWPKDEFIALLLKIVQTGDLTTQQTILKTLEKSYREEGFDSLFDSWGEMLPWMETFC
jgi:hypothetical protein